MAALTTSQKRILNDAACKMIALHKEVTRLEEHLKGLRSLRSDQQTLGN
jgi:hypothetical protein